MTEEDDSTSHELDGIDPDAPRHRQSFRYPEAESLVDDLQALREMEPKR
jgi:hypothetical protein